MRTIYTTNLTGTKMSQLGKVADRIQVGTQLSIHRRPDNSYDNQAMSVHFGPFVTDPQVGWIPAKEFEDKIVKGVLFNLMAHGIGLEGEVVQFEPETKFLRVNVNLTLAEDEAQDVDAYPDPDYSDDND